MTVDLRALRDAIVAMPQLSGKPYAVRRSRVLELLDQAIGGELPSLEQAAMNHCLGVDSAMTIDCSCGYYDVDFVTMTNHILYIGYGLGVAAREYATSDIRSLEGAIPTTDEEADAFLDALGLPR